MASVLPLATFGLVVLVLDDDVPPPGPDETIGRVLLFALAIVLAFAIFASYALATELTAPLRSVVAAVDRVSTGDLSTPIRVAGDDEFARLADSHNRLAADLERRNRELGRILAAIDEVSPRDDVEALVDGRSSDATSAFALIDATVVVGDPSIVDEEEVVPGVSRPLRAVMRAGGTDIGVLIGRLPATRRWEPADQDLLELFANEMAAAIRNAQLFATVESQNRQLLELDAAKDDFLRGVSHNLQTPLTSIRAYAEQLSEAGPAGSTAGDHRGAVRAAVADGPPAADGDPPGVRRAQAADRGRVAGHARAQGVGGAGRRRRALRARRWGRGLAGRRRRRTSSTRSCGPCWTTPSSTVAAPRSGPGSSPTKRTARSA